MKPLLNTPAVEQPNGTVLIVDDDDNVRQTFARMLRLEGYEVFTAENASSGLHEAEVRHLDAIILDLRMPLVNGLELLRQLRAHADHRDTRVAIVTGDYFIEDSVAAELQALGAELRFKPLWLEDLVTLTRSLIAARQEVPVTR